MPWKRLKRQRYERAPGWLNYLDQNNIGGIDDSVSSRNSGIGFEIINWYLCLAAIQDRLQTSLHQFIIESIRMVKVEHPLPCLLTLGLVELPVEGVLGEVDHLLLPDVHLVLAEPLHQFVADGALPGGSSPRHSDHEGFPV